MTRTRTQFLCRECGGVQSRWMGKCPDCGAWDALEKYVEPKPESVAGHGEMAAAWRAAVAGEAAGPATATVPGALPLPEIEAAEVDRMATGIGELDRVLGGGFVPGSVVLLGGDPGIGKSTLLLQAAGRMARSGRRVLYVSSEESAYQTRLRAERLFPDLAGDGAAELAELHVLADTALGRICEQARRLAPALTVIDSIQMVYRADVEAAPGSVAQLRRCCTELVYLAKVSGMAVGVVGHVTKDGQLAGPKLLEHLVDAVLSFEGDRHHAHRVVRAIKNRYGTTLEVGLFEMSGRGLREVEGVTAALDPGGAPRPGTVLCPVVQGSRALLVEVQALTAAGFLGSAKRRVSGLDASRLAMLIAVLEGRAGLRLADQDVFASVAGGLRVVDPAADLALLLAIAGAHRRHALPPATAAFGEVGLGGEVRAAPQVEARLREARRLGCTRVIVPAGIAVPVGLEDAVDPVATVGEALERLGG